MAEVTSTPFHSLQIANSGESLSGHRTASATRHGTLQRNLTHLFEEPKDGIGAQRRAQDAEACSMQI